MALKVKVLFLLVASLHLFVLVGCKSDKDVKYSFFVAGHVYGKPKGGGYGVYKLLKEKFDLINTRDGMRFGVFTGDIVRSAHKNYWDSIDKDLRQLNVPVHFSRGNHDGNISDFEERYGKSYYFFLKEGDLHIILDSNIGNWNIEGKQLNFLKQTINEQAAKTNNIFIYAHHIIWWDRGALRPNSKAGISKKLTFWNDVAPILNNIKKPVFIFAGDVGAGANASYSYEKKENLTLITSGMGGGVRDNFIVVDILNDDSVIFQLIALNGDDINGLGKLESN